MVHSQNLNRSLGRTKMKPMKRTDESHVWAWDDEKHRGVEGYLVNIDSESKTNYSFGVILKTGSYDSFANCEPFKTDFPPTNEEIGVIAKSKNDIVVRATYLNDEKVYGFPCEFSYRSEGKYAWANMNRDGSFTEFRPFTRED